MKPINMEFIPISQPSITDLEVANISSAASSGWISSLGNYLEKFEEDFARYCDVKHAISTSNGTVAIHLSLVALGIGKSDEVIIPDMTFVATANAVSYTGAKVVTVDIDPVTWCISVDSIEKAITEKTKAIIPVHIYGHPANMFEINKIAKKYNLFVIEDCAEAHGAEFQGSKVGGLGDMGTFSFYGNKMITTGEGGMITTNNSELNSKLRYLRDHAMSKTKRYWHTEIGFNYRMTNLQAALGCAQLSRIEEFIIKRKDIFNRYYKNLVSVENISVNKTESWAKNIFWLICVQFENFNNDDRDKFIDYLKNKGIDSRPFFYPISDMPMYRKSETPTAHIISSRGVCLPSFHDITDRKIDYICETIKGFPSL